MERWMDVKIRYELGTGVINKDQGQGGVILLPDISHTPVPWGVCCHGWIFFSQKE